MTHWLSKITYPIQLNTELKKLGAVYRLIEELRLEHNRVGAIALADWGSHEGRWQMYQKQFATKQSPLLIEQRRLKLLIRRANFTDAEWEALEDLSDSDYELMYGDKGILLEISTLATAPFLDELKAIDFQGLEGVFIDPLEDWAADYTEVDTSNVLSVAANTITYSAFTRTSDSWVYKDFGASHFGTTGLEHDIESEATTFNQDDNNAIHFWALANANNPNQSTDPIILQRMKNQATDLMRFRLEIDDGATDETDISINHDLSTAYYSTFTRESGGSVWKTYTDSGRTSLKDTMSVAQGSTSFQYLVLAFSASGSDATEASGFIRDLDLNEAAAAARRRVAFGAGWAARR